MAITAVFVLSLLCLVETFSDYNQWRTLSVNQRCMQVPTIGTNRVIQEAVALVVGSVPRRIVPKLDHFHWLLFFNNQWKWRNLGTILRGPDPTISTTASSTDLFLTWLALRTAMKKSSGERSAADGQRCDRLSRVSRWLELRTETSLQVAYWADPDTEPMQSFQVSRFCGRSPDFLYNRVKISRFGMKISRFIKKASHLYNTK